VTTCSAKKRSEARTWESRGDEERNDDPVFPDNGRRFGLLGLISALMLVVGACAQAGGPSGDQEGEGPIKIGLLQPLSGSVSAAGIAVRDGAEIALDEVNEQGGINGRQLELVIEDDQNDPAVCTSAANKVITRDQVVGVIGGWGSSCTLAIIPVIERQKLPLLVETSSSFAITDPNESGNDWTFRLNAPTPMEAAALEGKLVSELGFEDVLFLAVNNDWGRGSAEAFGPLIEQQGGNIVGTEYFEEDAENFAPLVTNLTQSQASSTIITTDAAQIALMLEQMHAKGLDTKVLTTGGSNFPDKIIDLAGEQAVTNTYHTIFFAGAYDPSLSAVPDRSKSFVQEWKDRGHEFIEIGEGARGYDAVYTMAEALESIEGDVTPASLRDALKNVELDGIIFGHIKFQEWNGLINQNVAPVYVAQVKEGGKLDFVLTPEL
jgi:branched-chain amino acid transport system substrate-binding protein